MTPEVSALIAKLSLQATVVHAAQAGYDHSVQEYRNLNPSDTSSHNDLASLRHKIDQQRTALRLANDAWEKLCEELLQLAGQETTDTGNVHINKMFAHAPTVLSSQRLCKEASDEYLASREQNHPDQAKLAEIRSKLDPAQEKANSAMQHWGGLCKELLQNFGQAKPPTEATAVAAC